jgi:hypothetical protein
MSIGARLSRCGTGQPRERRQNLAQREKRWGPVSNHNPPSAPRRGRHTVPTMDGIEAVYVAPTGLRDQKDVLFPTAAKL